jgi:hypothetical protein
VVPDVLFGQARAGTPENVWQTLADVWRLLTRAGVPARNVSLGPPSMFALTSAEFGVNPVGRDAQLQRAQSYVDNITKYKVANRGGMCLTFAQQGSGKSFFLQTIGATMSQDADKVVIPITFNSYMKLRGFERGNPEVYVPRAFGLRAAFAFFARDNGQDAWNKVAAYLEIALARGPVSEQMPLLESVMSAVDFLTGGTKQLMLLVDEMAASGGVVEAYQQLTMVADLLRADRQPIAVIATGLKVQDWVTAGVDWMMSTSFRRLLWIPLGPPIDQASEEVLVRAFRARMQHWYPQLSTGRANNTIGTILSIANGHWRTLEIMYKSLETWPTLRMDAREPARIEVTVVSHVYDEATSYWSGCTSLDERTALAMSWFLACSALGERVGTGDTMPIAGGGLVANWRYECSELGEVKGLPSRADRSVPLFALPHITSWTAHWLAEPSAADPPVLIEFARLHKELLDLALAVDPTSFEHVVAVSARLRLVAHDVRAGMLWQQRCRTFDRWPTADELPSMSGCDGRLWAHRAGNFSEPHPIKLVDYFDGTVICDRKLAQGDVIMPGKCNPAWDILVLVAGDGGRLGLRFLECKFGAHGANNGVLPSKVLSKTKDRLLRFYNGTLFLTSEHIGRSDPARYCTLLPMDVRDSDVELQFIVNGKVDESVLGITQQNQGKGAIRVSVVDACEFVSTVFCQLPMLKMQYQQSTRS